MKDDKYFKDGKLNLRGKVTIIVFFVLIVFFMSASRAIPTNESNKEQGLEQETTTFKTDKDLITELSNIKNNYKLNLTIKKDDARETIILSKDNNKEEIIIKSNEFIEKYYKVNENYYTIANTVNLVENFNKLNNLVETYINPISIKEHLINGIDSENNEIKSKNYLTNNNTKIEIIYNESIEKIIIDLTEEYNQLYESSYSNVIYEIVFSDINIVKIDEIDLYGLE